MPFSACGVVSGPSSSSVTAIRESVQRSAPWYATEPETASAHRHAKQARGSDGD